MLPGGRTRRRQDQRRLRTHGTISPPQRDVDELPVRPDGTSGIRHTDARAPDSSRHGGPDPHRVLVARPLPPPVTTGTSVRPQHCIHHRGPSRDEPDGGRHRGVEKWIGQGGRPLEDHPRRGHRHHGRTHGSRSVSWRLDELSHPDRGAGSLRGPRHHGRLDRQLGIPLPLRPHRSDAGPRPQSHRSTPSASALAARYRPGHCRRPLREELSRTGPWLPQCHAARGRGGSGEHDQPRVARHRGPHGSGQDRGRAHVRPGAGPQVRAGRHLLRTTHDGDVQPHVRTRARVARRRPGHQPIEHHTGPLEGRAQRGLPAAHALECVDGCL